jgi:hypothetical protein
MNDIFYCVLFVLDCTRSMCTNIFGTKRIKYIFFKNTLLNLPENNVWEVNTHRNFQFYLRLDITYRETIGMLHCLNGFPETEKIKKKIMLDLGPKNACTQDHRTKLYFQLTIKTQKIRPNDTFNLNYIIHQFYNL